MKLLDYRKNIHSQCGEDGILEKIFDLLRIGRGACVEFGAWDGRHFSNTCHLIEDKGWSGVLIEGSPAKFQALRQNFAHRADVILLDKLVGFDPPNMLDDLLATTPLPSDFDLLSIDVDGNDYHILESIRRYRPKVIVIEFNPTIPAHIEFVQARDLNVNQGASLPTFRRSRGGHW